jgi:glutamate dehydrogenase (NAD(P)+)
MTAGDGYARFHAFVARPPLLTVEWHDDETSAVGVLTINSLRGGAAGGGTRMRSFAAGDGLGEPDLAALRGEALFLAKTMEIKFRVCGPPIGGAKSVLHFDPADPRKRGVLARWFRAIGPYLRLCYGTGGDLNVDEILDVIPLTAESVGIAHPQQGVVAGHLGGGGVAMERVLENLRRGVTLPVALPDVDGARLKVADLVTGFGVVAAADAYFAGTGGSLAGRRVLVEGFGAVGGSAAYDFHRRGARVVGVLCKEGADFRWAADAGGLDVPALLAGRRGTLLPEGCPRGPSPQPFWDLAADVFVPAARSHGIGAATLDRLRAAGVTVIACGANNPFDDPLLGDLPVQRRADADFAVLPDFVANCGMARTFAYLMSPAADLCPEAVLADAEATIRTAVDRILTGTEDPRHGLMARALEEYVPASPPVP